MKKRDYVFRYLSLLLTILYVLRYNAYCRQYSKLYNFICNTDYWFPIVVCFIIFTYFYLKTAVKWRDDS